MNWKIYKRNRIGRELVSLSVDEERFLFSVIENNATLIRLPVHIKETIKQLNNSGDLSILEIVELTGKSLNCVLNAINAAEINVFSLDDSGNDNEYSFYDVNTNDSEDPLFDGLVEDEGIKLIYDSLEKLNEMERLVILYAYGLGVEIMNMVEFCKKSY